MSNPAGIYGLNGNTFLFCIELGSASVWGARTACSSHGGLHYSVFFLLFFVSMMIDSTGNTPRAIGYSFLESSWWVLPLELLHGLTFGATWAAGIEHTSNIAPPGLEGK